MSAKRWLLGRARWAKVMMTVQAFVAVSTIALVIARAVNVLN